MRGGAGEQAHVELTPPPESTGETGETGETGGETGHTGGTGETGGTPPVGSVDQEVGGLSPAFFISGLVLTIAAGAVATWSWFDTLAAADAWEMQVHTMGDTPTTRNGLEDGRSRELRTTLLDVATGVLGVTTVVLLFFTNWGGLAEEEAPAAEPSDTVAIRSLGLAPLADGGFVLGVGGDF